MLRVEKLFAKIRGEDKEILKGVGIEVGKGEIVAIMGPNGSGKSTLVNVIMGNEKYVVTSGKVFLEDEDITSLAPHERAKKGLYVSFQHPPEIDGIRLASFIPMVLQRYHPEDDTPVPKLRKEMGETFKRVGLGSEFLKRHINVGFSGGEKKRAEVAKLYIVKPKVAILDEIDSGIGGKTAELVGRFIKKISDYHQVFCITHLAQIASFAESHYAIKKLSDNEGTYLSLKKIVEKDKKQEIVRMIAGDSSENAIKFAEEILKKNEVS